MLLVPICFRVPLVATSLDSVRGSWDALSERCPTMPSCHSILVLGLHLLPFLSTKPCPCEKESPSSSFFQPVLLEALPTSFFWSHNHLFPAAALTLHLRKVKFITLPSPCFSLLDCGKFLDRLFRGLSRIYLVANTLFEFTDQDFIHSCSMPQFCGCGNPQEFPCWL